MRLAVYAQNGEHLGEVASDEFGEMNLYEDDGGVRFPNDDLLEAIDDLLKAGRAYDEERGADRYAANQNRTNELIAENGGLRATLRNIQSIVDRLELFNDEEPQWREPVRLAELRHALVQIEAINT